MSAFCAQLTVDSKHFLTLHTAVHRLQTRRRRSCSCLLIRKGRTTRRRRHFNSWVPCISCAAWLCLVHIAADNKPRPLNFAFKFCARHCGQCLRNSESSSCALLGSVVLHVGRGEEAQSQRGKTVKDLHVPAGRTSLPDCICARLAANLGRRVRWQGVCVSAELRKHHA